ncbi:MAG: glycosyltransferase family 9 protein [Bryobacteraceae bacterium]
MSATLEHIPPGAAVVIVRLRSLGDCVLTTPALALLKEARPDLRIAIVVEDRFRELFDGHTVLSPSVKEIRSWKPKLAINFHGGVRSSILTALSGAPLRAGFAHFRHSWIYNVPLPRAQEVLKVERTVHTAEHLASAMFHLGVPLKPIPPANLGPVPPAGHSRAYAILHPYASEPAKTWPAARFFQIAAWLNSELNLEPIFVAGPNEDLSAFTPWRTITGAPLKTLIANAALFLGNDSGPAHIAAAFHVPTVVIFGASDPRIWSPWRTPSEVLNGAGNIQSVTVNQVVEALARLRVPA